MAIPIHIKLIMKYLPRLYTRFGLGKQNHRSNRPCIGGVHLWSSSRPHPVIYAVVSPEHQQFLHVGRRLPRVFPL